MLATEVLVAHHNELRALLRELAQVPPESRQERRRVLGVAMSELSIHEQIEDEIFYPAMRDISALVSIAHAEHRQLSDQLAVVLRSDGPGGDRFAEDLRSLTAAVEHHAGKEESDMFPEVVRKVPADELEAIGDRLSARLETLRRSRLTRLRLRLKREVVRRTWIRATAACRSGGW